MEQMTIKEKLYIHKFTWLIISIALTAGLLADMTGLFGAHAASLAPWNGRYNLRGVVTAGPATGLAITASLEVVVITHSASGHACGLSYYPGHCALLSGTILDNAHVALTIASEAHAPLVHLIGLFQAANPQTPGSFTGFMGAFDLLTHGHLSNGHWLAAPGTIPSGSGNWQIYGRILHGKDRGAQIHGLLNLVQQPGNYMVGTFCQGSHTPCLAARGLNRYGYLQISLGEPASLVLHGAFSRPTRAMGQFYEPGKDDSGYWLIH